MRIAKFIDRTWDIRKYESFKETIRGNGGTFRATERLLGPHGIELDDCELLYDPTTQMNTKEARTGQDAERDWKSLLTICGNNGFKVNDSRTLG
jgi:hypothetical protein